MNKSSTRIASCVVSLSVVACIIVVHLHGTQTVGDAFLNSPKIKSAGDTFVSHGVMQRSEFNHLMEIEGGATHGEKASAADINFLTVSIDNHRKKSVTDTVWRDIALTTLMTSSKLSIPGTGTVHDSVYKTAISVLPGNVGDTAKGAVILGQLKDKRAIPYLLPYLNNPNKDVQTCVKYSLRMLGVSS